MAQIKATTGYCWACGGDVFIETKAQQPSSEDEGTWVAFVGDHGRCVDCGQLHVVDEDGDGCATLTAMPEYGPNVDREEG